MSKISSVVSSLVYRRSYSVVQARAVNVHVLSATTEAGRVDGAAADGVRVTKKDVFWMRDPKTGCWIPENRFEDDVDAVELRNRLLH
uniref:Late embryogenesis abundant n=1 Tax=Cleistogenes songorica TaxID=121774 RepID=A0A2S1WLT6_9POAL|nr:late embryogenesis abundant [Cleistogenes songorica]